MPSVAQDLTGLRYGLWTVVDRAENRGIVPYWRCRCDCGTEREVAGQSLRSGASRACGCTRKGNLQHGKSKSPEYEAWSGMIRRCYSLNREDYPRYGGRGITVCERWRESFENFYADMGPKPTPHHSIDRIDNDGTYAPDNCRWATVARQNRNRRDTRLISFNGETLCITDWAARLGIARKTIVMRLDRGWSVEEALTTPVARR